MDDNDDLPGYRWRVGKRDNGSGSRIEEKERRIEWEKEMKEIDSVRVAVGKSTSGVV